MIPGEGDTCAECAQIANARVAGMGEDLRLDLGSRYTIILLVFFITRLFFGVGNPLLAVFGRHGINIIISDAVKLSSPQNRKRQLVGIHRVRLGNRNDGTGTHTLNYLGSLTEYLQFIFQGFVKSYQALALCRTILGLFGAGNQYAHRTTSKI